MNLATSALLGCGPSPQFCPSARLKQALMTNMSSPFSDPDRFTKVVELCDLVLEVCEGSRIAMHGHNVGCLSCRSENVGPGWQKTYQSATIQTTGADLVEERLDE